MQTVAVGPGKLIRRDAALERGESARVLGSYGEDDAAESGAGRER